jgi:hypothetical protein
MPLGPGILLLNITTIGTRTRYYKKRKKLETALDRMWSLNALDHRKQALHTLIKTRMKCI